MLENESILTSTNSNNAELFNSEQQAAHDVLTSETESSTTVNKPAEEEYETVVAQSVDYNDDVDETVVAQSVNYDEDQQASETIVASSVEFGEYEFPEINIPFLPKDGEEFESPLSAEQVKGVGQMVAGSVIAAAGVPTMIIPGVPSALMIAGGASLAAKGQRAFSGREISKTEQVIEDTTEVLTKKTKSIAGSMLEKASQACYSGAEKLHNYSTGKNTAQKIETDE